MKKKTNPKYNEALRPLVDDIAKLGLAIGFKALELDRQPFTSEMILRAEAEKRFALVLKGLVVELGKVVDKHYKLR